MTNEEIKDKLNEGLGEMFKVHDVDSVILPHPFCITGKHIANSKGRYIEPDSAPCGMYVSPTDPTKFANRRTKECTQKCDLSHKEHKTDHRLVAIQLTRNAGSKEMSDAVLALKESFDEHLITQMCLIDTDEKFRISDD